MRDIRHYASQSWAVRRWDRFNKNKPGYSRPLEPQSFCQFWRTVLLWSTLAGIPIVGKMFLSHLAPAPTVDLEEITRSEERFERDMARMGKVARPFWMLLWPVRSLLSGILSAIVWVVGGIDDFVSERDWSQFRLPVVVCAALLVIVGVGGWLFLTVLLLIKAWHASWIIFLLTPVSVAVVLAVLIHFGVRALNLIGDIAPLLWDTAVASKHRVCPQITIQRELDV